VNSIYTLYEAFLMRIQEHVSENRSTVCTNMYGVCWKTRPPSIANMLSSKFEHVDDISLLTILPSMPLFPTERQVKGVGPTVFHETKNGQRRCTYLVLGLGIFYFIENKLISSTCFLDRPSLSILTCRSRYDSGLYVSVVYFTSRSMGQMRSTKSQGYKRIVIGHHLDSGKWNWISLIEGSC
jgi:hypothetical protein